MLEKTLESPLDCKEIKLVHPKGNQSWSLNSNTLATWCEELTPWARPWCWERLKAGGEGDGRGWDGWVASPTQWTWVLASSGSWWRTGKLGVLQSMESQRVGHDQATELNWTDEIKHPKLFINGLSFDFFCVTHSLSRPYAPVSLHCIWALMLFPYFKLLLPLECSLSSQFLFLSGLFKIL